MIELTAGDGHKFSAYRADASGEPKGAVVVLPEVYGVNAHIRKIADSFAAEGYVAIAPSLFDRIKAGVELGYDEAALKEGTELAEKVSVDSALADIQAAVEAVKGAGKVAVVGYGLGGYLAYVAANRVAGLACAIGYYGVGTVEDCREKRKVPTLIHFGEDDALIPAEDIVQFRASRPDVSAFTYPGTGQGFNCDERASYNAAAAQAALERTLFWISQFVVGQAPIQLKNAGSYAQAKVDKKKKKKEGGDDLGPPPA
jgi:carboxymethylenebutenolidase